MAKRAARLYIHAVDRLRRLWRSDSAGRAIIAEKSILVLHGQLPLNGMK
jgi:hypothetical protein